MIRPKMIVAAGGLAVVLSGMALTTSAEASTAKAHYVKYKSCTAMHKVYKHGVGRSGAKDHVSGHTRPVTNFYRNTRLYNLNRGLDRDHDGIACEAH